MRYALIRSRRKTLALTVDREGNLTVRAPLRLPATQIEAFVLEKADWVEKTRARLGRLPPPPEPLRLREGAVLPYLGDALTITLTDVRRVCRDGERLLVPRDAGDLAPVLRWVDAQARLELWPRVEAVARRVGLHPKALRLSSAKGRWGSMSSRGTLSLNRALLLCPPDVIDYVAVHELCHIAHPNHSPAFWALVERWMPDFRIRRDWLKTHTSLISVLPHGN